MLRLVIGFVGGRDGLTPHSARKALALLYLSPVVLLLALLPLNNAGTSGWWAGLICLSLPAYYAAWWLEEIPRLHWRLILPFPAEALMRAEEDILRAKLKLALAGLIVTAPAWAPTVAHASVIWG